METAHGNSSFKEQQAPPKKQGCSVIIFRTIFPYDIDSKDCRKVSSRFQFCAYCACSAQRKVNSPIALTSQVQIPMYQAIQKAVRGT